MMKLPKRMTHADETLKMFGIEPEYEVCLKENVRKITIWSGFIFFMYFVDSVECFHLYESTLIAVSEVLVFNLPLQTSSLSQLIFAIKIS